MQPDGDFGKSAISSVSFRSWGLAVFVCILVICSAGCRQVEFLSATRERGNQLMGSRKKPKKKAKKQPQNRPERQQQNGPEEQPTKNSSPLLAVLGWTFVAVVIGGQYRNTDQYPELNLLQQSSMVAVFGL